MRSLSVLVQEQCAAIDRLHKKDDLPRTHAAAVLLTATIAVIMPRLIGSPDSFSSRPWLRDSFASMPFPDMHAQLFWALFKVVHYGVIPALCIRFVLRRSLVDHGLRALRPRRAWICFFVAAALMLPLVYFASKSAPFMTAYPKYSGAGASLTQLALWELAYAFQFLMVEFFFRGFLLFSLARSFGWLAIFMMVVPYTMIHLQKPFAECAGSVITGIVLGAAALRFSSIYGGVLVHCLVAWSMDLFALSAKGQLAPLFSSH